MLACFALQEFTAHYFGTLCVTVMTTIAYSPRKKWSGWNLTNLTGGYGPGIIQLQISDFNYACHVLINT